MCGDQFINGQEECEVGVGFWTAENCAGPPLCTRKTYNACASQADCTRVESDAIRDYACIDGYCVRSICGEDEPSCSPQTAKCPRFAGRDVFNTPFTDGGWCMLQCNALMPCPAGLRCLLANDHTLFVDKCVGPSSADFDAALTSEQLDELLAP